MLDGFLGQHLTHIGSSGWVTDHTGSAAKKGDWSVSCHLKTLHQAKCHEMSYMKAVCGRVKSDVEGSLTVVYHFLNLIFVSYLGDQPSGFQFFPNCHVIFLLNKKIPGSFCPFRTRTGSRVTT